MTWSIRADHGSYFVTTLNRTKGKKERERRKRRKKEREQPKITYLCNTFSKGKDIQMEL